MSSPDHIIRNMLCFGDSNTWGYDPATATRYGPEIRWPGVMRRALGEGYSVIEEGLSGRTTVFDDPITPGRRGDDMLPRLCESHAPLDAVVIMLGTNDLKHRCNANPWDIGKGMERLALLASLPEYGRGGKAPSILLVAPPALAELSEFAESFEGGREKSRRLALHVESFAAGLSCGFLDAGTVATCSDIDGIHLEPDAHRALGLAIAEKVRALLDGHR